MNQDKHIEINISRQTLTLLEGNNVIKQYTISTAKNGSGEQMDSECTPRGKHIIREKIGAGCEANTVFVGREATGELYHPGLREQFPDRDWILTRILWLSGCETGRNKGGNVDSYDRYIYIHGCPDSDPMSIPSSHGCIKMRNTEVIELYDLVPVGTAVHIYQDELK